MRQIGALLLSSAVLSGCQNMPDYGWPSQSRPKTVITKPKPRPVVVAPVVYEQQKPIVTKKMPPEVEEPVVVVPSVPLVLKPVAAPSNAKKLADGRDTPAVQGLLASANDSLQQGNAEAAAMTLERAQRLAPQSATVYLQLAQVRLRQSRAVEAEQLARKGLSYAQYNSLQAALWRLVAQAAEQQGKLETAISANNKAMQLEMAGDRG